MNYQQTLDYLFNSLPMFQRIGAEAYKPDLSNTLAICKLTNNPQNNFPCIHIAGTNGKGSVSHMLASVFQESGFKTGLFTSPHLNDFRERIKINGQMVPQDFVIDFVGQYKDDFEIIKPSFFEMTFGLAMHWFNLSKVDIAILETGMGGRLDSTNVVTPVLSVITNIGFDHTQFLGNTLEAIATEKAGIIKPGIPVVIGETNEITAKVFSTYAADKKSPISFADQKYHIIHKDLNPGEGFMSIGVHTDKEEFSIECPLLGEYQLKNVCTVLAAAGEIKSRYSEYKSIRIEEGIKNTLKNTDLKGRWQILKSAPLTICDIGHNVDGISSVVNQILTLDYNHLHFVIGVVNDKDIQSMLALLPLKATYYFCKADLPRGLDAHQLQIAAAKFNLTGTVYSSVKAALKAASEAAMKNDLIFIGGSAFTVAEVV